MKFELTKNQAYKILQDIVLQLKNDQEPIILNLPKGLMGEKIEQKDNRKITHKIYT